MDVKSYEKILIFNVACKTQPGEKPLHIIYNKVDEYIIKDDSTKYLALFNFGDEKYRRSFDRVRYLICQKAILQIFILINLEK